MLKFALPSSRKSTYVPTVYKHTPYNVHNTVGKLMSDVTKRQNIVQTEYNLCKHKVGDKLTPYNKQQANKWGDTIEVIDIASNYAAYLKTNVWDTDDSPKIIRCRNEKGETFYCTPGFLIKKEV